MSRHLKTRMRLSLRSVITTRNTLLLVLVLAVLIVLPTHAQETEQTIIDPHLRELLLNKSKTIPERLLGKVHGYQGELKIDQQDALSLILRTTASRSELEREGIQVRSLIDGIATVTVLPEALPSLVDPRVQAIALPTVMNPFLDRANPSSGIDHLRDLAAGGFSGWTGQEVVVGVIDSGVDHDHPNFDDAFGNTRIAYLWDQTVNDPARFPAPFAYGTEWTATDIDAGVANSLDPEGHGTHVAGIAAGNGAAPDENGTRTYVGVAPQATIVMVKSNLADDRIIDGMNYIFNAAHRLNMPAVINMSFGSHFGAHEGTSPIEQAIDTLVTAQPGRAAVVAAGNSGEDQIYSGGFISANSSEYSKIFQPATEGSVTRNDDLRIIGYYDSAADFTITIEQRKDSSSPWRQPLSLNLGGSTLLGDHCSSVNKNYGSIVLCNSNASIIGEGTTRNEFIVVIDDDDGDEPKGEWRLLLDGTAGSPSASWDAWIYYSEPSGNWSFEDGTSHSVAMPASSRKAITVGAYTTKACWMDKNGVDQPQGASGNVDPFDSATFIAGFSSRGPTGDGRTKPDLVAPGSVVTSVRAQEEVAFPPLFDITDDYVALPGTSMAAPMVAGSVALLFEQDPTRTNDQIKQILTSTARQDAWTVASASAILSVSLSRPSGPNAYRTGSSNIYGAGKLDLSTWFGPDRWETNDIYEQSRKIVSGDTVTARVGVGDLDYFRLPDLEYGDGLEVRLNSAGKRIELTYQLPSIFYLCDGYSNYIELGSAPNSPLTSVENMTLSNTTPSGAIQVQGFAVNGMDYTMEAVIVRPEESGANGSTSNAQWLPKFQKIKASGNIASTSDVDYFAFVGFPGETLEVSVQQASGTGNLELRNSSDTIVAQGSSVTYTVPSSSFPFLFSQTFYVRLAGGSGGASGDYTVEISVP